MGNAIPFFAQRFQIARRSLPSTKSIARYISPPTWPESNTGTRLPCDSRTTTLASSRKRCRYSLSARCGSTVLMTHSFALSSGPGQREVERAHAAPGEGLEQHVGAEAAREFVHVSLPFRRQAVWCRARTGRGPKGVILHRGSYQVVNSSDNLRPSLAP